MLWRWLPRLKRGVTLVVAVIAVMGVVAALAYLSAGLGTPPAAAPRLSPLAEITARPAQTPFTRFVPLDPAVIAYLESRQPAYGLNSLRVLGDTLPPVGAYLPQTGSTRFALASATPLAPPAANRTPAAASPSQPTLTPPVTIIVPPTLPPYPTSPPQPPAPTPTSELVATVLAFAAQVTPYTFPDSCAPAGFPVAGVLTQRFHGFHSGADFAAPLGTPVLATHSGQVIWADWNTLGYGNLVIIQNGAFITYYAHLTSFNVSLGQFINKGTIIGWSGSTGRSSGPHVHYETRIDDVPVDPLSFESRSFLTC